MRGCASYDPHRNSTKLTEYLSSLTTAYFLIRDTGLAAQSVREESEYMGLNILLLINQPLQLQSVLVRL